MPFKLFRQPTVVAVAEGNVASASLFDAIVASGSGTLILFKAENADAFVASRIALLVALTIAFVITLFVGDVIAYFQKVVGSLLPGVGVTMLLGRFWRRATWQGAYASILSGTLFGLVVLFEPSFAEWVRLTFGGPAIPATAISLMAGIAVALATPRSTASEADRLTAVFNARNGKLF